MILYIYTAVNVVTEFYRSEVTCWHHFMQSRGRWLAITTMKILF